MDHDAADRFRSLVATEDADPPLDEGALLIAATATGADIEIGLARLDDLAAAALAFEYPRTPAGLARVLFVDWAFAGNTAEYDDPRNSFLPDVIDRRLGLPITLSVLMIEVGRRIGVALHGVGMPGHFLVGVDGDPDEFIDPFHAGAALDRAGCRERFVAMYGEQARFAEQYLEPTSSRLILLRMVTNLQHAYGPAPFAPRPVGAPDCGLRFPRSHRRNGSGPPRCWHRSGRPSTMRQPCSTNSRPRWRGGRRRPLGPPGHGLPIAIELMRANRSVTG